MSAIDLFWEIIFFIENAIIILLSIKERSRYTKKSSRLPFTVFLTLATILMALRLITWFV